MTVHCTLWKNVTYPFFGYQDGDGLCNVWEGDLTPRVENGHRSAHDLAEQMFALHNRDDRPTGQIAPSMSVGDVAMIGEGGTAVWLACDSVGFRVVPEPSEPYHRKRTKLGGQWIARTAEEYLAATDAAQALARELGVRVLEAR